MFQGYRSKEIFQAVQYMGNPIEGITCEGTDEQFKVNGCDSSRRGIPHVHGKYVGGMRCLVIGDWIMPEPGGPFNVVADAKFRANCEVPSDPQPAEPPVIVGPPSAEPPVIVDEAPALPPPPGQVIQMPSPVQDTAPVPVSAPALPPPTPVLTPEPEPVSEPQPEPTPVPEPEPEPVAPTPVPSPEQSDPTVAESKG